MTSTTKRILVYTGGALVVFAAVVFSDSPLLRPLTEPQTAAQREMAAARTAEKETADIAILFIGNSHLQAGEPVRRLVECFEQDGRGQTVFTHFRAMGHAHMEEHLASRHTLDAIDEGGWDYIVLQGQNYSASGRYEYPTDACIELGQRCVEAGAVVLLFPEWRQVGNDDEAVRVQKSHEEIAPQIPAQIVPVGLAWDRALARKPDLALHATDGNHSSSMGGYLTGLVFYACISGRDPRGLAAPAELGMSKEMAELLQTMVSEMVEDTPNE